MTTVQEVSREAVYGAAVDELQVFLEACPYKNVYSFIVNYVISVERTDMQTGETINSDFSWDELCQLRSPDLDYTLITQVMNEAVEKYRRNAWVYCLRARARWAFNQYEESTQDLLTALHLAPENLFVISLLGETYYLMEQYARAIKYLSTVIGMNAQYARAYFARALCYEALGDSKDIREHKELQYNMALRDAERAEQLKPQQSIYFSSFVFRLRQKIRAL